MTKKSVTFRLPVELLEAVDEARGDVSRTRFVERALEAALAPIVMYENPGDLDPSKPLPPAKRVEVPRYVKPFNPRPKGS